MNTYAKYCPNVYVAKCDAPHEKGEVIMVITKYGKENPSIVFNLVFQKDGFYYYSIVREDGFNYQEWAKRRAEKLNAASARASSKSDQYYKASQEGADFLALGEPIKVGHHSEKRHRALIERNWNRMGKSVELSKSADDYASRAEYWEEKAKTINESMPESLEYFEFKLEQARAKHLAIKEGRIPRRHSFDLQYANKDVKNLEKKLELVKKLWY
jgi:hypothetical protein